MNVKIILAVILAVCVVAGIYISQNSKYILTMINVFFQKKCSSGNDCMWKITNCCPETSGAKWECVNLKTYKEPECLETIICPQVLSPKPTAVCLCSDWECVVAKT